MSGGHGGRRFPKQQGGKSRKPERLFRSNKSAFTDDLSKGISMSEQLRREKERIFGKDLDSK